ncbi:TPA: hypothetical protein DIC38_03365 [Candidatus Nomurabacteria bacterium]|nr:MAG: hypothetical protein O210_OD1C00001G0110 [Parcubacteria bacterium RAAC4_OD1_1]HCY26689.1 hypothetical protein [Candidatus Nomurabacteria bacterium]
MLICGLEVRFNLSSSRYMNNKAQKGEYLDILLRSKNSVFSTKDIALLWRETQTSTAQVRLNYYVKAGKLIRVRRGIYAKDKNYDKYEFATKIFRPSYVSFETVLGASGMTFQYYGNIFIASYIKREIKCDGQTYSFIKIKDTILSNPKGIDQTGEYAIASKERAFLDTIYRSKKYYIDNLSPLDWDKVFEILPIYNNKKMAKTVQKYYENYKATK